MQNLSSDSRNSMRSSMPSGGEIRKTTSLDHIYFLAAHKSDTYATSQMQNHSSLSRSFRIISSGTGWMIMGWRCSILFTMSMGIPSFLTAIQELPESKRLSLLPHPMPSLPPIPRLIWGRKLKKAQVVSNAALVKVLDTIVSILFSLHF